MLLSFAGHSLGGALATLAAYDVRAVGKKYGKDCKVSCYTCASSPAPLPDTGPHANALHCFRQVVADRAPSVSRFGAPRTGNHAFATDFQQMVPDCWCVSLPLALHASMPGLHRSRWLSCG